MNIVGVCRFSLVGRGDWKAFQKKSLEEANAIAAAQAESLFQPDRMEARLKSFEMLTLASLRAQTDQNFLFIVLASDLMPEQYRSRLNDLCETVPQVVLRFFPITTAGQAQKVVFNELGLSYNDCLQFRLDDDDCLCSEFISLMKEHTTESFREGGAFVASIKNVLYAVSEGDHSGVYYWPVEFMSAGAAIRHPTMSVYHFGHYAMAKKFPNIVIDENISLVTHNGTNDTSLDQNAIKRRQMKLLEHSDIERIVGKFFPFLTDEAKSISGIPLHQPDEKNNAELTSAPNWYLDLHKSRNKKGFYISYNKFAIQHTERSKNVLYVSFDNLSSVRGEKNRDPWGYNFAAKSDWSNLGVLCYRPNWFRIPNLFREFDRLASDGFFSHFRKVVFSGTSMGAYAACAFSSLVPGSIVIAFSPQSTLNPEISNWDKRYPSGSSADWSGPYSDAAKEMTHVGKAWIVYDPNVNEDRLHAERLSGPNVILLKARYSSHFTAQYLRQIGALGTFVNECVSGDMTKSRFYQLYRSGRSYRRYLGGFVKKVTHDRNQERKRRVSEILRAMDRPGLATDIESSIVSE